MPSNETKAELTISDKTLTSGENDYETPSEGRKRDLVYDYLYQDAQRVASFLAQFETYGVPSQVKATETEGRTEAVKTGLAAGLKVPLVGHGQGALDTTVSSEQRDAAERTYDPALQHARTLLDFLAEHDMICRDLSQARIGQFVLVSGSLGILDLAMLNILWDVPIFRDLAEQAMASGMALNLAAQAGVQQTQGVPQRSAKNDPMRAFKAQADKQAKGMLDLIRKLPHTTQARIVTAEGKAVYSALKNEGLTGSTSDLLLKNGTQVPGKWSMLGILDALPDVGSDVAELEAARLGLNSGPFTTMLSAVVPLLREFGRPAHAAGITPLMIFRAVVV